VSIPQDAPATKQTEPQAERFLRSDPAIASEVPFPADNASRSIFSTHDNGGWQPSMLRIDKILGSWIRGNVYNRPDGARVYGYVYDAGSDGGAGMNRFSEVVLSGR